MEHILRFRKNGIVHFACFLALLNLHRERRSLFASCNIIYWSTFFFFLLSYAFTFNFTFIVICFLSWFLFWFSWFSCFFFLFLSFFNPTFHLFDNLGFVSLFYFYSSSRWTETSFCSLSVIGKKRKKVEKKKEISSLSSHHSHHTLFFITKYMI